LHSLLLLFGYYRLYSNRLDYRLNSLLGHS